MALWVAPGWSSAAVVVAARADESQWMSWPKWGNWGYETKAERRSEVYGMVHLKALQPHIIVVVTIFQRWNRLILCVGGDKMFG
jgi:hypothetical protein